jgi:hypothetical protein
MATDHNKPRLLITTPTYRLEPETWASLYVLWAKAKEQFRVDLYLPGDNKDLVDLESKGVRNHLGNYNHIRNLFLDGDFDYWINVESDMILPNDTFEKLTALIFEHGADIGTGHYVFRNWRKPGEGSGASNVFARLSEEAGGVKNIGQPISLYRQFYKDWLERKIFPCSGGALGCIIAKRWVLEQIPFRIREDKVIHCDTFWMEDCWTAKADCVADLSLVLGHKDTDGTILYPFYCEQWYTNDGS